MVHITSQNHGYVVDQLPKGVVATHVNINDGTIEGMKHTTLPIYSVQFHPEAAAGPRIVNIYLTDLWNMHYRRV